MVGLSREFGMMTNQKLYSLLSWLTKMVSPLKAKHLYLSKRMIFARDSCPRIVTDVKVGTIPIVDAKSFA